MFKLEQEEYSKEKITWESITFVDNLGCIDLIEGQQSASILRMLDEECMLSGTHSSLIKKLNDQFQYNKYYARPKDFRNCATKFIIKHYAGEVQYETLNFVEKNKDKVNERITELLSLSRNPLLK